MEKFNFRGFPQNRKEILTGRYKIVWACAKNSVLEVRDFITLKSQSWSSMDKNVISTQRNESKRISQTVTFETPEGEEVTKESLQYLWGQESMSHESMSPRVSAITQTNRAVSKWLSKVIMWLRLLRLVIGLKNSRQFFNQWQAKPNPIAPCPRDFCACLELWLVHGAVCSRCDWSE